MNENEQQKLILDSDSKRIVVLACPGSGKTTTLTKKIIKLHSEGVSLKRILSVTFTRKAAKEMYERIAKEIPVSGGERRNICTLHSFGSRLLFKYKDLVGLTEDYSVAIKSDKIEIISEILNENNLPEEKTNSFLEYVSSIKNGFLLHEDEFNEEQFKGYCSKMIEKNLIDLDDYIYLPVKLLKENSNVRAKISSDYDYIYVDEYQDINKIQNDLLDLLINENTNVLYVGDDDQSIYEFRGSNPNYILEKSSEGSGYDVYFLTTNYRSQKTIVDLSKKVLSSLYANNRREKEIIASKNTNETKPIRHAPFLKKQDEIEYVINEIYRLVTQAFVEPKEIAVLCRYTPKKYSTGIPHPELLEIGNGLKEKGISASMSLSVEGETKTNKSIKDLCNYLNGLNNESLNPKLLNTIRDRTFIEEKYKKLIDLINIQYNLSLNSDSDFSSLIERIIAMGISLDSPQFQKRLNDLKKTYLFAISQFDSVHHGAMPSDIISELLAYYKSEEQINKDDEEMYESAILFTKSTENEYEENENNDKYNSVIKNLEEFLYSQTKTEKRNCVRLLTAHQSKGLQFDVVFVVGLEAGSFPSNREILDENTMDNERRLFYVCVTRARELLYLTSTGVAINNEKDLVNKSFVYPLPESYFSQRVDNFSSATFTYEENNSLNRKMQANEEMVDKLESEHYQTIIELENAKEIIRELEKKNNQLFNNDDELNRNKTIIANLRKNVDILIDESKEKDNYLALLQQRIESSDKNVQMLENKINSMTKTDEESKKQFNNLLLELNNAKQEKETLKQRNESLLKELDSSKKKNDELKEAIQKIESSDALITTTETVNTLVTAKIEKCERTNKTDFIFQSLIETRNEIVSPEIKNTIKKLYKVFIIDKKYQKLASDFTAGLSSFQDFIIACEDYRNNDFGKDIFRSKLKSASYKTNLMNIVRGILRFKSNFNTGKEFPIYPFLLGFIDKKQVSSTIRRYVDEYISKSLFDRQQLSIDLAKRMKVCYAISIIGSHEEQAVNNEYRKEEYWKTLDDFISNPNNNYFRVASSFLEFIAIHIDDEKLMNDLSRL